MEKNSNINDKIQPERDHIKEYFLDAVSSTTIHGIDKVFKPKRVFLKILWTIFFLVSTAACGFFIANTILAYFRYEIVTKIQVIYEVPQLFPTVSICNYNIINGNRSIEITKRLLAENGLPDPFNDTSNTGINLTLTQINILGRITTAANQLNPKLNYSLDSFEVEFEDFFVSCTFNLLECNKSNFEKYFDINYGICFRFNYAGVKPEPFKSYRSGLLNSFKLELFVPNQIDPFSFAETRGVFVIIQNASETSIPDRGVSAQVGAKTFIGIERQFINKLEQPYSECIEDLASYDSDLYREFVRLDKEYKQNKCFELCYQKFVLTECGCIDPSFYPINDAPVCFNITQLLCDWRNFLKFFSKDNLKAVCGRRCPLECKSQNFLLTTSSASFPTQGYADQLVNRSRVLENFFDNVSAVTFDDLKNHLVALEVFYSDMKYTIIEETEKMSFLDVISSVGGTLGLFIGMSFLSFLEIIDVILEAIVFLATQRSKNSRVVFVKPLNENE